VDYTTRAVRDEDADGYTRVRCLVAPQLAITGEGTRHRWHTASPSSHTLCLVAELDATIVGVARASINTWTSASGSGMALVAVHPQHRNRGIGGGLYEQLEAHLREHGAVKVSGWGDVDEATTRWCAARGLTPGDTSLFSRLDLSDPTKLPPAPRLPDGVTLASYVEIGPRPVYEIDAATMVDEPSDIPIDAVPYQEWYDDIYTRPEADLESSTVVLVDGQPAAITTVECDPATRRMWSGGTGTLRRYRGRGLAKLAKSIAVRKAATAGITAAFTGNDETNKPMLAVNSWLGYRKFSTERRYRKDL
jgi:GNAT superfamily N-acetyltransferase